MVSRSFVNFCLLFHLVCLVSASPSTGSPSEAQITKDEDKLSVQDALTTEGALQPMTEKPAENDELSMSSKPADLTALQQTGKVLPLATLLPAETLHLLQMFAVPSTTVPANLLEEAANVSPSPSEGLPRIDSLKQRAGSLLHDKILKPVENLVEAGVSKSRSAIPTVMNGNLVTRHFTSLRNYLVARQIDSLQENIASGLLGLKRTLELLTPTKTAVRPKLMGRNVAAEKISSQESTTQQSSGREMASPGTPTPKKFAPESSASENVDSESQFPANVNFDNLVIDIDHIDPN